MNPEQAENKPEIKNEQEQIKNKSITEQQPVEQDAPSIKSEENQANWKKFREQREAERKARELAEKAAIEEKARAEALKAALEAITNKPSKSYQNDNHFDNHFDNEETEEQRIDKRVKAIIAEREAQADKERQQREQIEYPQRLLQNHPDFNKVCSSENLDYLEFHYPEIAVPFQHLPDGYDKWSSIYKAVKRFVPNHDSKNDMAKADRNLQKPGSVSSPGKTQGESALPAARLDEARKAANWDRMQKVLKGLN